jgi:DNA modification methylase
LRESEPDGQLPFSVESLFTLCSHLPPWEKKAMGSFSDYRQQAGLSLGDVEELLKLSVDTVAEYEGGARIPTPREIQTLKGLALGQTPRSVKSASNELSPIHSNSSGLKKVHKIGPFPLNEVIDGDCSSLIGELPDNSIDVLVTSPPYWGQRVSNGTGVETDPRDYLQTLTNMFSAFLPKLKSDGLIWINIGDAYNTPVNWRIDDHTYSSLGPDKSGLDPSNSAYIKPRAKRKAFVDKEAQWLQYGNLLSLPYRLTIALCDAGYLFRGEVIWRKRNPMPEGRCRRPHRQHEAIYLFAKREDHSFRVTPPVGSVWEFGNEKIDGLAHFSRFPEELPRRCIEAYGKTGDDVVVFDPFSGSGTTGIAAIKLGCSYVGFEIDPQQVQASNDRIRRVWSEDTPLFNRERNMVHQR